jgi:hypothetical protein
MTVIISVMLSLLGLKLPGSEIMSEYLGSEALGSIFNFVTLFGIFFLLFGGLIEKIMGR